MKKSKSIQLKAAFLLLVFSVNTIIGFACSIGLDIGFNSTHHHDEETAIAEKEMHRHHHGAPHHHAEADNHHKASDNHHNSKEGKDNCCNDKVTKFSQLDKAVPQSLSAAVNPTFLTAFISSFYGIDILSSSKLTTRIKPFVRWRHPTIPDIRIAIQSFQI